MTATEPRSPRAAQVQQPDQGLRVARLGDQLVELRECADVDVDALVLGDVGRLVYVGEAGREEEVDLLVGEAGRGEERAERLPVLGLLADLLGQLALGGLQRLLALLVELAGGQLEQVRHADRLARLPHQPDPLAVVGDDADGARVRDEIALDLLAVLVAERGPAHREELALVEGL
jgi:hypothetical protein